MGGMADRELTPHGELLDRARVALGISQREAARRAHISEGRWRQVVTGVQRQGGLNIPVNPKAATVAAMARAVDADVRTVLAAAGLPYSEVTETATDRPDLEARVAELERRIAEVYAGRDEPFTPSEGLPKSESGDRSQLPDSLRAGGE